MDYSNFANVLEYIPMNMEYHELSFDDKNSQLIIQEIHDYITSHQRTKYIVSLSGGVDSMVLVSILCLLNQTVIGIHINYNNRPETKKEEEFLRCWSELMGFELIVHNIEHIQRGNIKRSEYEITTKNIRFDLYNKVANRHRCTEILLGHHKDDIIENVFNNICRGRNILDLSVLKTDSTIKSVIISRPLLNLHKEVILKYAHQYNIPYFKDSTPDWSLRGIFRRQIYPLLDKSYSNSISKNLLNIADQSSNWNSMIEEKIIVPFINTIEFNDNIVELNIKDHINSPCCFWKNIFMRIFYQYGQAIPSHKSISHFIDIIKNMDNKISEKSEIKEKSEITIKLSKNCIGILHICTFKLILNFKNE